MKSFYYLIALILGIVGGFPNIAAAQLFGGLDPQDVPAVNKLENGGFENGESRWTESGSSVLDTVTSGANLGSGSRSGSWDASAASETLTSSQVNVDNSVGNELCVSSFRYKGGDSNLTAEIIDGSLTVLGSVALTAATEWTRQQIPYTSPTSGTIAFRVSASADAAIIYLDDVFVGCDKISANVNPIVFERTDTVTTFGGATGTITHNKNVPIENQIWSGVVTTGSASLQLDPSVFITDKTVNSIDYDFSALTGTDTVTVKLSNTGFESTSISPVTYNTGLLSSAPSFPINHGLPGRPLALAVWTEGQSLASKWDVRHDLCSADDTTIDCDFSGLTIDGTHRVQIIASMHPIDVAVKNATGTSTGLVYKTQYIVDQNSTGLANATASDIGSGSIVLPPGTYLAELGAASRVVTSSDPSIIRTDVFITDAANTTLGTAQTEGGLVATSSGNWLVKCSGATEFTIGVETTIKLRGQINVTGGTVTSRNFDDGYIIVTKQ